MTTAAEYDQKTAELLAIEWLEIAEGRAVTENASMFLKFMAVWITFTTLYDTGDREEPSEIGKWKKYMDKNPWLEETHRKLLESTSTEYASACRILKKGAFREGWKKSGGEQIVYDIDYPEELKEPDRLDNLMYTIYAVRVNLFHGCTKSPENPIDYEKVQAAYTVLYNVIEAVAIENSNQITKSWIDLARATSVGRPSLPLRFAAAWISFQAFWVAFVVDDCGIKRTRDGWKNNRRKFTEQQLRRKFIFSRCVNENYYEGAFSSQEHEEQLAEKKEKANLLCKEIEKIAKTRNAVFHGREVSEREIKDGLAMLMFFLDDVSRDWRQHYRLDRPNVQLIK